MRNKYKSIYIEKFIYDELTARDFRDKMSPLTFKHRKVRNKTKGREARLAKLVDFDFKTNTTIFLTEPTFTFHAKTNPGGKITGAKDNAYTMKVEFVDLNKWKDNPWKDMTRAEFVEILEVADIKLDCDCMAFHWQGHRYKLGQLGSAIHQTGIADPIWGPRHDGEGGLCKHLGGLVNIMFFAATQVLGAIKRKASEKGFEE